jgi:hypothetical protein
MRFLLKVRAKGENGDKIIPQSRVLDNPQDASKTLLQVYGKPDKSQAAEVGGVLWPQSNVAGNALDVRH